MLSKKVNLFITLKPRIWFSFPASEKNIYLELVCLFFFFKYARNLSSAVPMAINGSKLYYVLIPVLNIKFVSCFPKEFFR